jgi:FkbM family methyltransferase
MRPSTLVLKLARIHPAIAAALAGAWGTVRRGSAPPHWLLVSLREMATAREERFLPVGVQCSIAVSADGWLSAEFNRHGGYEPATTAVCQALLRPGMVAIDAGANVGYFTVLFAELVSEQGRVLAFEPALSVYKALQRNVRRNKFDHVQTVHAALSNTTGTLALYYSTSDVTHSLRHTTRTTELTETVDVSTLDAYVQQFRLQRVDLIKIDVEGADLHVLEGATTTLATFRPYVIVEASEASASFGYGPEALSQFLAQQRYRVLALDQPDPLAWSGDLKTMPHTNLLGVPIEKSDGIIGLLDVIARARQPITGPAATRKDP